MKICCLEVPGLSLPKSWKKRLLDQIYTGHLGINSCRKRARDSILVRIGHRHQRSYGKMLVMPCNWQKTSTRASSLKRSAQPPLEKNSHTPVHFRRKNLYVIVDCYSGYVYFKKLSGESCQEASSIMKKWVATHGVPKVIETDSGPQEFKEFSKVWKFDHITSSSRYAVKWSCWVCRADHKRNTKKMLSWSKQCSTDIA